MTEQEFERFEQILVDLVRLSYDMADRLGERHIYEMPKLYEKCKEHSEDNDCFDFCTLFEMCKRAGRTHVRDIEREFETTIGFMPFEYDLER